MRTRLETHDRPNLIRSLHLFIPQVRVFFLFFFFFFQERVKGEERREKGEKDSFRSYGCFSLICSLYFFILHVKEGGGGGEKKGGEGKSLSFFTQFRPLVS